LERAYSNRPDDVAAEIARHYAAGHDGAKASEWYMRAARAARLVFAYDDVVRFVTFALDAVDNSETTFELLLMREEACARLGRREEQYADLERLDELMAGDVRRCEIARRRIEVLHASDDRDAERRAIGKLRVHAEAMNDRRWQGVADGAEAWLEISVGAYERAESFARRAIANLETGGSAVERVEAFCALAEIQIALGNETAALDALELAQAVAQEASDDRVLARALMQVVAAAVARQQFDCAIQVGERVAALYRSQGDLIGEATAIVSVAAASLRMSRWAAARDANVRAARTFELAGDRRGLARVYMNLGMLHGRCADFEEGRAYFARARVLQERLGDERARTAAFLNESFLALWQQRPDEAKALAMQALACAMHMNHASFRAAALANLGAAERDLGELDAALAHVEEGLAAQLELGRLPDAVSDLADAALTHAIRGNMKIARMHVDRILDLDHAWASAAFPPWVAARVLHAAGDPRAFDVLASASKLASTFSASIDVPELRTCFDALPFIVELKSVCGGGAWPPFRTQLRHGGGTAS
jgi:tetratricopeptide (TPR) repeat protein